MSGEKTTERMEIRKDGGKAGQRRNAGEIPGRLCHVGVYLFLLVFMVLYVFYAPEGYIQIATNKYRFYRKLVLITGGIMIPLIALQYLSALRKRTYGSGKPRISSTDVFLLSFLVINCISFFLTPYKEEALWGTSGWYMGFAMMLSFIGIYFVVSRFYDRKIDLFVPFMAVTAVVFLWGLLNRFSVYPVDMQYDNVAFISCIGNINWFCGYWSVFFAIGVVLYIVAKDRRLRIIAAAHSVLSLATGVVEGSDSAYISMGAVFFFLFLVSFRKTVYMKRWLEECIFLCGSCQVMRVIAAFGPDSYNEFGELSREGAGWGGLNLMTPTVGIMLGNLTLAALAVFVVLRILLERADKKYGKSGAAQGEWINRIVWLKYAAVGLTVSAAAIYLTLLIINTRTPGILGPLSKYRIFLFDGSWGSRRGATWRDGLAIYRTLPLRERLFGVGQDCFSIYGYSVPELAARFEEEWPTSRLTNAHNECITFLVNLGVFGLISFVGIFAGCLKRLLVKGQEEPLCYVFAASLLSYFFHNQFSFSQVMNIPYVFLMFGLAENLMRNTDERNGKRKEGQSS